MGWLALWIEPRPDVKNGIRERGVITMQNCFVPADILLPGAATPLDPWACIAVDQFTSQPEYWQKAEELAKGKPSTLHIVLPEAYLGTPQEESRLAAIRAAMQDYRDNLLTRCVHCCVLGTLLVAASQNYNLLQSIGFGFGSGVGYLVAVLVVDEGRRRLRSKDIPHIFRGLPSVLIYIGILSLAIYGLVGTVD